MMIANRMFALAATLSLALFAPQAVRAEDISGLWYGVAAYTGGDPDFDHQTVLMLPESPQTGVGKITYIYPALGVTCRSDLTFVSAESAGTFPNTKRIWRFADDTQTAGCVDGTVRITASRHLTTQLETVYFEWITASGQVENAGTLTRVELPLP